MSYCVVASMAWGAGSLISTQVVKIEITPKEAGNPHGPPGFYLGIGGDISALAPPAADAPAEGGDAPAADAPAAE